MGSHCFCKLDVCSTRIPNRSDRTLKNLKVNWFSNQDQRIQSVYKEQHESCRIARLASLYLAHLQSAALCPPTLKADSVKWNMPSHTIF